MLQSLEDEHGIEQRWALDSPQLLDGVAQLCLHRVRSLQAQLDTCSSRYVFTKVLQEHIGPARKQHRSLDKQLQRQCARMRQLICQLLSWVPQLQTSVQHLQPPQGADAARVRQEALESVGLQPGELFHTHIFCSLHVDVGLCGRGGGIMCGAWLVGIVATAGSA